MDVLCVREATKLAAEHCRSGKASKLFCIKMNVELFTSGPLMFFLLSGSHSHGTSDLPLSWTQYE